MKKMKDITTFDEHSDQQYGKKGTPSRIRFEQGFGGKLKLSVEADEKIVEFDL